GLPALMNLGTLGEVRQVAAAVVRDQHHVLDPGGADVRVIEAGLYGDHVPRLEAGPGLADPGHLMGVDPDPVARAVEEPLHASVEEAGLVPCLFAAAQHVAVDRLPVRRTPDRGPRFPPP